METNNEPRRGRPAVFFVLSAFIIACVAATRSARTLPQERAPELQRAYNWLVAQTSANTGLAPSYEPQAPLRGAGPTPRPATT